MRKLFRMIRYDVCKNYKLNKWRLFISLGIISWCCMQVILPALSGRFAVNIWEAWYQLFRGCAPFHYERGNEFRIPVILIFYVFGLFYFNGNYVAYECGEYAAYSFPRGSRAVWWLSKCTLGIVNALLYWSGTFLILCIMAQLTSGISWDVMGFQTDHQVAADAGYIIRYLIAPPLISMCAMSMLQIFLEMMLQGVLAYLICGMYFFLAMYIQSPYLLGNYMTLLRSELFADYDGWHLNECMHYSFVLLAVCAVVGYGYLKRKDLFRKTFQ